MQTQNVNVKTAAQESSGRWGKTIGRIFNEARFNVACAEEAHAHYGERFTRRNACAYFIRGVMDVLRKIGNGQ